MAGAGRFRSAEDGIHARLPHHGASGRRVANARGAHCAGYRGRGQLLRMGWRNRNGISVMKISKDVQASARSVRWRKKPRCHPCAFGRIRRLAGMGDGFLAAHQSQGQATPGSVQAYLHSLIVSAQRWLIRVATSIGYTSPVKVEETYDIRELTKNPEKVLVDSLGLIMKEYRDMVSTTSPVQRAISFIHEHLGQSLSLQQVAKHVHMNPNYFSEMFKKETGQNYIEFVTQAKLRKAMHLLRETPAKISEIANEIGYEDIKYFNRLFKKWTGQTPSEYRANPEFCPSMD